MDRPPPAASGLAQRSLTSFTWTAFAGLVTLPVSFVQTVLLARLLPVEFFGLFGGLAALVSLSYPLAEFGLSAAVLHRAPETQDEDRAMAVFFTLRLLFSAVWAVVLLVPAVLALTGLRRDVLVVLVLTTLVHRLAVTGQLVLIRRVEHRRLAVIDILQTVLVFLISVTVAALTGSVWALTVAPLIQAGLNWFVLAVYRPVWRPRLAWDPPAMRYFLGFGGRMVGGNFLAIALDYIDDLWTNLSLGDTALGLYSRAYRFANYPRSILAEPVNTVTTGMYAELKGERALLSRTFFRINALLVRSGFLLAGWLALIAPHFIVIFLGEKWLPMLVAFRLMLIYTLLDPIKLTVANVLFASGQPERATLARVVQFVTLIAGLFILGPRYGIAGVALAVDLMLVVGIVLLLVFARRHVDFSVLRLFAAPTLALAVGLIAGAFAGRAAFAGGSDWLALVAISLTFVAAYSTVLLALERGEIIEMVQWGMARLRK